MTVAHRDNRLLAIIFILSGIGFAATQDAIVKSMSGAYPAYETMMLRCVGSVPVLMVMLWRDKAFGKLLPRLLGRVFIRGFILGFAYLCFVLSIAAMPIANAVAIYFTMPFFVAGLAGPMLGEKVRIHRWLAIIAGFIGVMIMVRPGVEDTFEWASIFALLSALGYAIGQMYGRPLAQQVSPIVIAVWQNIIYFSIGLVLAVIFNLVVTTGFSHPSLAFLSRPLVVPDFRDFMVMLLMGVLAAFGMIFFVNAYRFGEANFVAPFEYSSMIWAVFYGLVIFGDFPDGYTWAGAAVVIGAGLLMIWRDRQLNRAS
ncbi:MAG: DMT family transporter [Alphaproteobacteria bacterium]|nr:DMT family transporter [Alphaproteobacteria bacterium]